VKRGCLPKLQSEAAVHVSHNGPTAPSTPRTPKSTHSTDASGRPATAVCPAKLGRSVVAGRSRGGTAGQGALRPARYAHRNSDTHTKFVFVGFVELPLANPPRLDRLFTLLLPCCFPRDDAAYVASRVPK
jgi:hypothetical protein